LSNLLKRSLTDQVYELLREDIIKQVVECGKRLTIKELEEKYKVSQTPIRESLNRLYQEGLVEYVTNVGTQVFNITLDDVLELNSIYNALDCCAIKLAMQNDLEKVLVELKQCIDLQEIYFNDSKHEEYSFYANDFHMVFYRNSGNKRLEKLYEQLKGQFEVLFRKYVTMDSNKEMGIIEHKGIYNAVFNNDKDKACALMDDHYSNSVERIMKTVQR